MKSALRWLRRIVLAGVAVGLLLIALAAALVIDGLTDNVRKSDVAIVLGNTVMPDGYPSPWLRARLDRAVSLYKQGLVSNVIASGAAHPGAHDEGTAMRDYLVCMGVPAVRVIADNGGTHTMETGVNAARIMKAHGWKSATVVSQYYHINRSRMVLHAFGVRTVYSAHAYRFERQDWFNVPRETAAWITYRWRLWFVRPPS